MILKRIARAKRRRRDSRLEHDDEYDSSEDEYEWEDESSSYYSRRGRVGTRTRRPLLFPFLRGGVDTGDGTDTDGGMTGATTEDESLEGGYGRGWVPRPVLARARGLGTDVAGHAMEPADEREVRAGHRAVYVRRERSDAGDVEAWECGRWLVWGGWWRLRGHVIDETGVVCVWTRVCVVRVVDVMSPRVRGDPARVRETM